jgi:hypothetical protein
MHWDAMMNDLIKYECHSERSEESQSFKTKCFWIVYADNLNPKTRFGKEHTHNINSKFSF